ncbi:MAG: diaminopimelate decarboxylase, partial [Aquificaceae bacterium]
MLKEYNPYLEYKGEELYLEGVSLRALAEEFGTPLYIYSSSYIRDRIRAYRESFPEALICYAVKANFNPYI